MNKNKTEHPADSKIIIFASEAPDKYNILIDKDSNAPVLLLEFFSTSVKDKQPIDFTFNAVAGIFGQRQFFKVEFTCKDFTLIEKLARYLEFNILFYSSSKV